MPAATLERNVRLTVAAVWLSKHWAACSNNKDVFLTILMWCACDGNIQFVHNLQFLNTTYNIILMLCDMLNIIYILCFTTCC